MYVRTYSVVVVLFYIKFGANMDRWRKFAVLVVLTLVTTALPGSRCSAQIRKAGFGDSFGSGTPRRDEDSSLFLRHGEWSARMRRDLEDKCDSSLFKESEMLELPATIGPTDRADVNSLKELYIRLNLRVSSFVILHIL